MKQKVILISIDGMRPDGFLNCKNEFIHKMMEIGSYSLEASSVFPSVTLPCHMSIFHSVPPERHGITTNIYMPPVRPISGLFEQINAAGGKSGMFYGWEPLRDVARPGSLQRGEYVWAYSADHTDGILANRAFAYIKEAQPDFVFLYMVETDEKGGHDSGWMTDTYLQYIHHAIEQVKAAYEQFGEEYTIIVTADHGGHDRAHGSELPEDMTIPMFFIGTPFEAGKVLSGISLLDIAPTVVDVMGVSLAQGWEGKSILKD